MSSTSRSTWVTCSAWTLPAGGRDDDRRPLGGVDALDVAGSTTATVRRARLGRAPIVLVTVPNGRCSIRRWSQPSNHSAAVGDPAIGSPSASRCSRASASSRIRSRSSVRAVLASCRRTPRRSGCGPRPRRRRRDRPRPPAPAPRGLGVGRSIAASRSPSASASARNARRWASSSNSSSTSQAAIDVPVLGEQRDGDELGVLPTAVRACAAAAALAAGALLGHPHEVGDRQPDLRRHLAGVQLAHVGVGVLVDDRHRPLGQPGPVLRRAHRRPPSPAAGGSRGTARPRRRPPASASGSLCASSPGSMPPAGGPPRPARGTAAPTRRSARPRPGRRRRRRRPARPGWRSASAAGRGPR